MGGSAAGKAGAGGAPAGSAGSAAGALGGVGGAAGGAEAGPCPSQLPAANATCAQFGLVCEYGDMIPGSVVSDVPDLSTGPMADRFGLAARLPVDEGDDLSRFVRGRDRCELLREGQLVHLGSRDDLRVHRLPSWSSGTLLHGQCRSGTARKLSRIAPRPCPDLARLAPAIPSSASMAASSVRADVRQEFGRKNPACVPFPRVRQRRTFTTCLAPRSIGWRNRQRRCARGELSIPAAPGVRQSRQAPRLHHQQGQPRRPGGGRHAQRTSISMGSRACCSRGRRRSRRARSKRSSERSRFFAPIAREPGGLGPPIRDALRRTEIPMSRSERSRGLVTDLDD